MSRLGILGLVLVVVAGCGEAAPPPIAVLKDPIAPKEEPVDAEAWCAIMIQINTRHGFMVDRRYRSELTPPMMHAILDESVERFEEIREAAPRQLKEETQIIDAAYRAILVEGEENGWETMPQRVPSESEGRAMGKSLQFQQRYCGVTFETPQ